MQNKYKDKPEKMNTEMQKFYKENGINPMSGCLPMLIQLLFMFLLYYAISQPLKYVAGKSAATIETLFSMIPQGSEEISRLKDMSIISYFSNNSQLLKKTTGQLTTYDLFNMDFLSISLSSAPSSMFSDWLNPNITSANLLMLLIPLLTAGTSYLTIKIATYKVGKTRRK